MTAFIKRTRVLIEVKYFKIVGRDVKSNDHAEKELVAALDKAADQITTKDYAAPFRVAGKKVVSLAIAVHAPDEVAFRFIEP
jgi:hypothetical protein